MTIIDSALMVAGISIAALIIVAFPVIIMHNFIFLRRHMHLLFEGCDPVGFCIGFRKRLSAERLSQKGRNLFICYLCLGLYYCGEYDEMEQWIREAAAHTKHSHFGKIMLIQHQVSLSLAEKKFDLAQRKLEEMESLMADDGNHKKLYGLLQEDIEYNRFLLRLAQGDMTDAEEILRARFEKAKRSLPRVLIQGALAEVYVDRGQTEQAITALKYVVQHGNKLHIVFLAQQKLQELGEPVVVSKGFLEGYAQKIIN